MEHDGDWTYRPPATNEQIEACEREVGWPLPQDLRSFLLRSNGGEAWFTENRRSPGFFLSMLNVADIAGTHRLRREFSDDVDLVPFASDGASEYFYLDSSTGSVLMINNVGTRADGAMCGSSVTEFLTRLSGGWNPFEQLTT